MKKIIIISVALLALLFTACTPQNTGEINETTANTSSDLSRDTEDNGGTASSYSKRDSAAYRMRKKTTMAKLENRDENEYELEDSLEFYYYDKYNNEILVEYYNPLNFELKYSSEREFECDKDGNIIIERYSSDVWTEYKYKDGNKIKSYDYRGDKLDDEITYEYNENGDVTSILSKDSDTLTNYYEYEYDEKGRNIVRCDYNSKKELERTLYNKYDDNDNMIEGKYVYKKSESGYPDDDSMIQRYVSTYDENGNKLSVTHTWEAIDETVSEKLIDIFEYDEQNRVIREERFDNNGDSLYVIDYVYETSWN